MNESQTKLLIEQDANTAVLAKATTRLPGLNEQVGFLTQQLASLRDIQKQTDEKAKQDGAAATLKTAAEKATAATKAMNAALEAAKAQHDNALAQTKSLPSAIAAGQMKIEKTGAEITLCPNDTKNRAATIRSNATGKSTRRKKISKRQRKPSLLPTKK